MSKAIPFLILTNEDLLKILNHFAEQAEKDMTVGEVYNACENFCKNNPEQGWNLVDYMKKNNKPKFLINALVGLSVNESEKVFNYTNNLYRTEFITQAIIILGFINYNTIEQVNKTFEKFKEQLKKSVKENIIALSNSLGRLLYQPITAKYNLVSEIFGFISQILNKKIPEAQYNILNNLTFINEKGLYNEYKVKLLKYFYDASYEYKGIIQNLSYYLHDLKNPLIILDFLRNWILNHDEIKDLDDFEYALQDSYTNNPEQFIEEYIKLLIHPKAKIRNTIKTIFKIVILSETNKELWIKSINSLTFKQQKLLFKSLNDYSIDIKDRLTIGSLLIKTHNHNVYKFLLQEFVWLIQDFGSMIKDILDNIVDKNDGMEADFINAFINYYQEITTFWKKKSEVNELNPTLNQTGIFNKFNEIYQKKQNEFFSNYKSDKTSFLNMITKVQIGRGRMFKMGDNSAPGYMSKFETSYIIPRTLMIFPEYYNYSWNKLQNEEWEENDAKTHC
ncbi:MAG: hypothetical protein HQ541_19665 [Mariniphaga sp.]|nr:hypothetical protein [Mariniphaga sp.]